MANDVAIAHAASMGSLELNPFLPLIAVALLENLRLLRPPRGSSPTASPASRPSRSGARARRRRHGERDCADPQDRLRNVARPRRDAAASNGRCANSPSSEVSSPPSSTTASPPPMRSRAGIVKARLAPYACTSDLRTPQRRQVLLAERAGAPAGLDRLRGRRHHDRSGREADGDASARSRPLHRHGRNRRHWRRRRDAGGEDPGRPRSHRCALLVTRRTHGRTSRRSCSRSCARRSIPTIVVSNKSIAPRPPRASNQAPRTGRTPRRHLRDLRRRILICARR